MRTEFVQDPTAELDVFHGNALGNLQFEGGGRQTRLLEHSSDQSHKIGMPKLVSRKIYRHPQRMPRSAPSLGLGTGRSEEHTSELQSRPHLVCRLLLEKKKFPRWLTKQWILARLS